MNIFKILEVVVRLVKLSERHGFRKVLPLLFLVCVLVVSMPAALAITVGSLNFQLFF